MIDVRQVRLLALGATVGALVACRLASDSPRAAQERRAAALADQFVQRGYRGLPYQRVCTTRMRDGYVFTFRLRPEPNVEYADVLPWPVIALPDSGAPRALQMKYSVREVTSDSMASAVRVLDSATLAGIARGAAPSTAQQHCFLSIAGGALVQAVPRDGSVHSTPLHGTTIWVASTGERGIFSQF